MAGCQTTAPLVAKPPEVPVQRGEEGTTWRAGDFVFYGNFACHDGESMIAIAERRGDVDLRKKLVKAGKCFFLRQQMAAFLQAWIAGPFPDDDGNSGSVWRILDQVNDTEFIWLNDQGGRHAARREMAL